MSKSYKGHPAKAGPISALDAIMLAHYRRHWRGPDLRADVRTLLTVSDDYSALSRAGDLVHALGAGLELADVGLRIAVTPSPSDYDLRRKVGFFSRHFGPVVRSFSHDHVALIGEAAVTAELALAVTYPRAQGIRRTRRTSDASAEPGREPPASAVPQARMRAYADTAEIMGDMDLVLAAMTQTGVDRDTLAREGRHREALGADRLVAGMARRLCATAARSEGAAEDKIRALVVVKADVLAADKPYRPTEASGALMAAMIDAAILVETRTWLATHTRH